MERVMESGKEPEVVAVVMGPSGAAPIRGFVEDRFAVEVAESVAGEAVLRDVREFFERFCECDDYQLTAAREKAVRSGRRTSLLDDTLEQVSRDLGFESAGRCSHVTTIPDPSDEEGDSATALYEVLSGGWLLAEYYCPDYCDDECDVRLSDLTYYPAHEGAVVRSEIVGRSSNACAWLASRMVDIVRGAARLDGCKDELKREVRERVRAAVRSAR